MNISIVSVLIIFLCDVSRDAKLLLIDSLIFLYLSFLNAYGIFFIIGKSTVHYKLITSLVVLLIFTLLVILITTLHKCLNVYDLDS
ncbi:hypothetical protein F8184_15520 [Escherichia coli W]|nr:hypothetical protein F8184_15520 [Escherichia coli W]